MDKVNPYARRAGIHALRHGDAGQNGSHGKGDDAGGSKPAQHITHNQPMANRPQPYGK
ncbi:MAG: hypothetical protein WD467_01900 [Candidatus Saccharimonadales bacterium]